jgi:prophage antirepressor-like protein
MELAIMSNNIVPFIFQGYEVRTAGDVETPLFVAADVCKALEIKDASDACERIPDDWKGRVSIPTPGGVQELLCVSEPGLYELIFASRKQIAKQFRRWVFEEVLPTIRKTGKFELAPPPLALPPADVRITELHKALTGFGFDLTNPRFVQPLQDLIMDKILGQAQLPAAPIEVWAGVAEVAEQMGYSVALVVKHRSQLGRFVSSASLQKRQENRLCNGTQRPINLYLDCPELRAAIAEFMDAKVLANAA